MRQPVLFPVFQIWRRLSPLLRGLMISCLVWLILGVMQTRELNREALMGYFASLGREAPIAGLISEGYDPDRPHARHPSLPVAEPEEPTFAPPLVYAAYEPALCLTQQREELRMGHRFVARVLFGAAARPDVTDEQGRTALMIAHDPEFLRLVLEAGAQLEKKDRWEQTALVHAVCDGDSEKVRLLVAAGADVNATINGQPMPLRLALSRLEPQPGRAKDRQIVAMLLRAGAVYRFNAVRY